MDTVVQESFQLRCTLPDGRELQFKIDSPVFTIGRDSSNQAHVPDSTISKTHAEARRIAPGRVLLKDTDSLNGVRVNGNLVQECELEAPCSFQLATIAFHLSVSDPPVPVRPRRNPFTLLLLLLVLAGVGLAGFQPRPPAPLPKVEFHTPELAKIPPEPLPLPSFRGIEPLLVASAAALSPSSSPEASGEVTPPETNTELPSSPAELVAPPTAAPPRILLTAQSPETAPDSEAQSASGETPPAPPNPGLPGAGSAAEPAEPVPAPPAAPALVPFFPAASSESKPVAEPTPPATQDAPQKKKGSKPPKPAPAKNLTVLILGDSLSLCGFGKRLDSRFRQSGQIKSTYTYMACGTVPLSWIKTPGYAQAKTCCGFWSIEQTGSKSKQTQDTYGMTKGYKPGSHPIPKIEELLPKLRPDILVIQTGTNLFGLFPDTKTIHADRHDNLLRSHIEPFLARLLTPNSPLRKIYWIAPPTSGRVAEPVQEFVFDRYEKYATPVVTLIDSRPLISFPYSGMQPDREHFMGADMDRWADQVYEQIAADFAQSTPPLLSKIPVTKAVPVSLAAPKDTPAPAPAQNGPVTLKGRLLFKSPPLQTEQLLPYQESLTACVYEVLSVSSGQYSEKEILVMHPAHIRLEPQPLDNFQIGQTYELTVRDLDNSPWASIKSSDQSGKPELLPYIQSIDDHRFPSRGK
jgi:hypothetical protein